MFTFDLHIYIYVALCCSVLQCVAMCCSVLQCVAVCCSDLHNVCKSTRPTQLCVMFVDVSSVCIREKSMFTFDLHNVCKSMRPTQLCGFVCVCMFVDVCVHV